MLLIAVSYRRRGRNLWAKLYTVINSLYANHAYLKTLYSNRIHIQYSAYGRNFKFKGAAGSSDQCSVKAFENKKF